MAEKLKLQQEWVVIPRQNPPKKANHTEKSVKGESTACGDLQSPSGGLPWIE
jgi:hypothetical protein